MWHPLSFVAESRRVDAAELIKFAADNEDKYGICESLGRLEVNTWYVDKLVADFKAKKGEVSEAGSNAS